MNVFMVHLLTHTTHTQYSLHTHNTHTHTHTHTQPSHFVALNRYGDVLDHLALSFLKNKVNARSQRTGDKDLYIQVCVCV
jgi:hypothetical protein